MYWKDYNDNDVRVLGMVWCVSVAVLSALCDILHVLMVLSGKFLPRVCL